MRKPLAILFLLASALTATATAQTTVGIQPFGSYAGTFDQVNLNDFGVHIDIPLFSHKARGEGMGLAAHLVYDPAYTSCPDCSAIDSSTSLGWRIVSGSDLSGYLAVSSSQVACTGGTPGYAQYGYVVTWAYTFVDGSGFNVPLGKAMVNACLHGAGGQQSSYPSGPVWLGYSLVTAAPATIPGIPSAYVVTPSGKIYWSCGGSSCKSSATTDSNGNQGSSAGTTDDSGVSISVTNGGVTYTDTSGNPQTIELGYTSYDVVYEQAITAHATVSMLTSITMPDKGTYQFTYQPSSLVSGAYTPYLASVTLPTGGTITYQTTFLAAECNYVPQTLVRTTSDGATTYSNNATESDYRCPAPSKTTIAKPDGSSESINFVTGNIPGGTIQLETTHSWLNSAGATLRSTTKCYNGSPCTTTPVTYPFSQIAITTTLNDVSPAQTSQTVQTLNTQGLQTELDEYDYGATTPTRKTVTTYASLGNNIANRPATVIQEDNGGYVFKKTTYGYDEYTLATSAATGLATITGSRGNLTSEHDWNGSTSLDSHWCYDKAGQVVASQDPAGSAHGQACSGTTATTYTHDSTDTYVTGTVLPRPTGTNLSNSATYDPNTGLPLTSVDLNGQTTTYKSYNSVLRPTEIDRPDGGKTTYGYLSPTATIEYDYQDATHYAQTNTVFDGYGRTIRTAVVNGQGGAAPYYLEDTCYGANGLPNFKSYAYSGTAGQNELCSGAGDTYTYDALGRVTKIAHADGTGIAYKYAGRATETIDENGVTRISQVNALGQTTYVCEVTSTALYGVSPANCNLDYAGTGFLTSYAYDLDHGKTTVTQGAQTRVFQTDDLGRPIVVTEPELITNGVQGVTTYGYAYSTTAGLGLTVTRKRPKANQSSPTTLTTTVTQYDTLGRVVGVTYTDGTPAKTLTYDQATAWGSSDVSLGSSKGRLTEVYTTTSFPQPTFGFFAYDAMGRITRMDQCLPSTGCDEGAYEPSLLYTYDFLGNLLTSTDAAGTTTTYTYTPANEIKTITSNVTDSTHPAAIVSTVVDGPNGPLSYSLGNGLGVARGYDTVGRANASSVCPGAPTLSCSGLVYGYNLQWQGVRNTTMQDSALAAEALFTYDAFNRLSNIQYNHWDGTDTSFGFAYDRYGNRWSQTAPQGGATFSAAYDAASNRIVTSGYDYDAAGNMTGDGFHTYTYDAEGNITAVDGGGTAKYTYNVLNQRVRIDEGSAAYEFRFNPSGQRASVWDGHTYLALRGQFYWGATPVAYYTSAATHFQHLDYLGTARMQTGYNGAVEGTYTSRPWGDGSTDSNTGNSAASYGGGSAEDDAYHFAGLDHDYASNTEHAQFRNYSPAQGRWLTPDPYAGSYNLNNPQSMNRYAYALNNPLSLIDPSGLDCQYYDGHAKDDSWADDTGEGDGGCGNSGGGQYAAGCPDGQIPDQYGNCYKTSTSQTQQTQINNPNQEYVSNDTNTPLLPGVVAVDPNRPDVPIGIDIFHCPSCVNTWKQSNCVVSQPLKDVGTDMATGAAGDAAKGALGPEGGYGSILSGAWQSVKEGTLTLAAAILAYGTVIYKTADYTLHGCPNG